MLFMDGIVGNQAPNNVNNPVARSCCSKRSVAATAAGILIGYSAGSSSYKPGVANLREIGELKDEVKSLPMQDDHEVSMSF